MKTRYRLFSCIRVVMRQKSKTCNRRYPFPRTYCQASSYIDGDARAVLRETQDLECAEGHSNFGILSSFNSSPARTIRASLFIDERAIHLGSRPARDNHWSTLLEQTWLVLAERYLTVHDGPLHCLFYSQSSAGKFRPLSHH